MNRVLIVEDETNVREPLAAYLAREGFAVRGAASIAEAESCVAEAPEAIVLDWMLPDGQGIELLKRWRARGIETPVLLLTARAELVDKVLGLELGANDYLTKPFEPRELVARIRVQLRQAATRLPASGGALISASAFAGAPVQVLSGGGIALRPSSREVSFAGASLLLTKTEFALLRMFLENPNQVFSREELLKKVWGYDQYPTTRTVDTHVLQLRQKTSADLFETVHGIGYRFRPDRTKA